MNIAEDLLYTANHEWIRLENDTTYIGITDFSQKELIILSMLKLKLQEKH